MEWMHASEGSQTTMRVWLFAVLVVLVGVSAEIEEQFKRVKDHYEMLLKEAESFKGNTTHFTVGCIVEQYYLRTFSLATEDAKLVQEWSHHNKDLMNDLVFGRIENIQKSFKTRYLPLYWEKGNKLIDERERIHAENKKNVEPLLNRVLFAITKGFPALKLPHKHLSGGEARIIVAQVEEMIDNYVEFGKHLLNRDYVLKIMQKSGKKPTKYDKDIERMEQTDVGCYKKVLDLLDRFANDATTLERLAKARDEVRGEHKKQYENKCVVRNVLRSFRLDQKNPLENPLVWKIKNVKYMVNKLQNDWVIKFLTSIPEKQKAIVKKMAEAVGTITLDTTAAGMFEVATKDKFNFDELKTEVPKIQAIMMEMVVDIRDLVRDKTTPKAMSNVLFTEEMEWDEDKKSGRYRNGGLMGTVQDLIALLDEVELALEAVKREDELPKEKTVKKNVIQPQA